MKKAVLFILLGLLVTSLTGCSEKITREETKDSTEEIVEKTVTNSGFKSEVICEEEIINIDKYSTLKGTAQQIEEKLIANNIIIKNIEIGTSGDKIKINYILSDGTFLLVWFNESETIYSATYTNQKEEKVREIVKNLVEIEALSISDEDKNEIISLEVGSNKIKFGDWNCYFIENENTGEYVFQIAEYSKDL